MVCNDPILPIPSGIGPINWLWDKFKKFNPFRSVISLGISPNNLFLDRSILVTKPRMFRYSSPLPFSHSSTLTIPDTEENCVSFGA
ncbi:hypothetical protein JHK87_045589 [Glycine soja]|nr:hypothetical protein JHK87_045589 [Glycine soja]